MQAVNYTKLRDNMKEYFDKVVDDCEPMIVTRKGENMVIMSQSSYDSLMETVYLVSNNANYNHLMRSISQHKENKAKMHELCEENND